MIRTKIIMGMPVIVEIADLRTVEEDFNAVFSYFRYVDAKFSTYKSDSEISKINRGEISEKNYSEEMREVLRLSEETKRDTYGYFNIFRNEKCDPSGLVKGWAIYKAAQILKDRGLKNFYVDAGGDIQTYGQNPEDKIWKVGIQSPFDKQQIVKVVYIQDLGLATSGTYVRGQHIYNPLKPKQPITEIVSLSVIGPNIYEADRFATAAFAMGKEGINFIEGLAGFEGYMIDQNGLATMTSNFEKYTKENV